MQVDEYHDPLFDDIVPGLDDQAPSGSSGTAPASDADAQPQSPALAEAIRNASHALNLHDVAAAGWLYWVVSSTVSDKINGKKTVNGKKKAMTTELTTTGEIPQCLKDRMQSRIPGALQPAGVTGQNGRD